MGTIHEKSNDKTLNSLSRIEPLAFVVGAAGFLGSFICEELVKNKIQVVGLDNFETGKKENLENLTKLNRFHLINQSIISSDSMASPLSKLQLPRLDYAFFLADSKNELLFSRGIANFLAFIKRQVELEKGKKNNLKIVLVSSVRLYDEDLSVKLIQLKKAEATLAQFAKDHDVNARIVRLAPLYGPRMHFREEDPMLKLIQAALKDKLNSTNINNDFLTRAIYVKDAASLVIRSVLVGGTAHKIYDGELPKPIKVSEIRQILMDPLWFEMKGFIPTEMPPWKTPNIDRSVTELSWKPSHQLIPGLKETLIYIKERAPELIDQKIEIESKEASTQPIQHDLPSQMMPDKSKSLRSVFEDREKKVVTKSPKTVARKAKLLILVGILLIFLGIFLPIFEILFGLFSIKENLKNSSKHLSSGEFELAQKDISSTRGAVGLLETGLSAGGFLGSIPIVGEYYQVTSDLVKISNEALDGISHANLGAKSLYGATQIISGETSVSDPLLIYKQAEIELKLADAKLAEVTLKLDEVSQKSNIAFLNSRLEDFKLRIDTYKNIINKALAASQILPKVTGIDGKKTYLVLFQNNLELRPTGGFIGSYGKIVFENGKLQSINVDDIYNIDGQLKEFIEPPAEIKSDLKQDRFFLRDSNFDPDFPTSARIAALFFNKEAGEKVNGVIAVDLSASGALLKAVGGVDLAEYSEHVDEKNLFAKVVSHAEVGFFPGSQAKRNYLASLETQLFNKVFFLSKQNWPGIIQQLGDSLDQKHVLMYFVDPDLLAYASSQNWVGLIPRGSEKRVGETDDFVSLIDSNMGVNKANFYLDRKIKLETLVGKEGEITQKLKVVYKNNSPSEVFPAGIYKNRLRVYLKSGVKLTRAVFKGIDILGGIGSFSDYNRSGYSLLLEVSPHEEATLDLEYSLPENLDFKEGKAIYNLNVLKQPGTDQDSFDWTLSFPINFHLDTASGGQEFKTSTNLLQDKAFRLTFTK